MTGPGPIPTKTRVDTADTTRPRHQGWIWKNKREATIPIHTCTRSGNSRASCINNNALRRSQVTNQGRSRPPFTYRLYIHRSLRRSNQPTLDIFLRQCIIPILSGLLKDLSETLDIFSFERHGPCVRTEIRHVF